MIDELHCVLGLLIWTRTDENGKPMAAGLRSLTTAQDTMNINANIVLIAMATPDIISNLPNVT
ncbi:MAG: hypothetical protein WD042_05670 [Phycisphaeraceae bacterium]